MGNAETLWSENSGDKRIAYRGKECYLSKRIYFIGEEDGNFVFHIHCYHYIYYILSVIIQSTLCVYVCLFLMK